MSEENIAKLCALAAFIVPPLVCLIIVMKPEAYLNWGLKHMSSFRFFGTKIERNSLNDASEKARMIRAIRKTGILVLCVMTVIWYVIGKKMLAEL